MTNNFPPSGNHHNTIIPALRSVGSRLPTYYGAAIGTVDQPMQVALPLLLK